LEDALIAVRALDAHHLQRSAALDDQIRERIRAKPRASVQRHREQVARLLEGAGALLIAGGHVGVLLNRLRLFRVLEQSGELPIVAWSGGAMVLTERIVLFHDRPPQGAGDAEVYAPGLGLLRGVVPLPHASARLDLHDPRRVAQFARRFGPAACVALDAGTRLDRRRGEDQWRVGPTTRVLCPDGQLVEGRAA
jgi:hypothetical protein